MCYSVCVVLYITVVHGYPQNSENRGELYGNYYNLPPQYTFPTPAPNDSFTSPPNSNQNIIPPYNQDPSYANQIPPSYGNPDLSNSSQNQPQFTIQPSQGYKLPSLYDNKVLLPWCQDYEPAPAVYLGEATPTTPKPVASPFKYQNQSECLLDYDDPCNPQFSEKPEFLVPGRRISEAKCMEYIWNIKRMQEIKLKNETCEIETQKNETGYYDTIPAAVGGRAAFPGEFPHMGAVGWVGFSSEWLFKCGSSLISPNFVLTAAHCSNASSLSTDIADPIPKIVRFTHVNIDFTTRYKEALTNDVNIKNIIIHPNYNPPKKYFDIALMELEREVGFSQMVQPACLWTSHSISELGAIATLTGWGALQEGNLNFSPTLQAVVLDFIGKRQCDSLLHKKRNRNWSGLQDHQICAAKLAGGVDACQGDSGGPLQINIDLYGLGTSYKMYYVVGVTAFGFGCARRNLPGVYTRVSSFIDWIEPIVWK